MQFAGLLGFAAFTLASFIVGFRLAAIGISNRQLPEFTIGAARRRCAFGLADPSW